MSLHAPLLMFGASLYDFSVTLQGSALPYYVSQCAARERGSDSRQLRGFRRILWSCGLSPF